MLNDFQTKLVKTFATGDYAHITTIEEAEKAGDTLFLFLFIELSYAEGCDSLSEARRRIGAVYDEIKDLYNNL